MQQLQCECKALHIVTLQAVNKIGSIRAVACVQLNTAKFIKRGRHFVDAYRIDETKQPQNIFNNEMKDVAWYVLGLLLR